MKSTTIQVITKCEPIVKGPFLIGPSDSDVP